MAEEQQEGNIRQEYNNATVGLNLDQTSNQIKPGMLTYALNAAVENFDANSVNYQNEPGNELCVTFPNNFVLIGTHFIQEKNKHIFFLKNPVTEESEIGFMDNNDCVYQTLVNANCLNFDINYPIHKVVHKISNCSTEIFWPDNNGRRYLDIESIPRTIVSNYSGCDPLYSNELDCNQLKLQPNFNIPQLDITDVVTGGNLIAGVYQFAIQYSDSVGNPYTAYYSITNPCPIADPRLTTANFNYAVGKSIVVNISNLDETGQFQYFNLAVIKTINDISTPELIGTYFIDSSNQNITYTGQMQIGLSISDIFEKFPYYELADDITAVQDILVWKGLTSIDRVNYQSIASNIALQWETYKIPATENYADELNATNLRGYLRDEVYAFEIVFLLKNGKQTDGFHIPGRVISFLEQSLPNIPNTNPDFIGEGTEAPYWKIYNTASVTGPSPSITNIGNATPHEYGEFAYWESADVYPCNEAIWGDLAGQPIRHHKFPDVLVSPHFESAMFTTVDKMVMQNDAVFPIGVKINVNQVQSLITSSNLTLDQKDNIEGFKIVRGNRGTNKSIIGKGILRNVNTYEREGQNFYFPNYPYNDLNEDPFLLVNNNAYTQLAEPWLVTCTEIDPTTSSEPIPYGTYEFTDPNTNKPEIQRMYLNETYEFCSNSRPIWLTGKAYIGPANYDVWKISSNRCKGFHAQWSSPFTDDNTDLYSQSPWLEGSSASLAVVVLGVFAAAALTTFGWLIGGFVFIVGGLLIDSRTLLAVVATGGNVGDDCDNGFWDGLCKCGVGRQYIPAIGEAPLATIDFTRSRRSSVKCGGTEPLPAITTDASKYRQVFNSPETSFGQPFLGNVLKLENVIFGKGQAHFIAVKNNAKYKLLSKEAQEDALASSDKIGRITNPFNAVAMFTAYQSYLTIYVNGITRKNYAYSYNSIMNYDYWKSIDNNLGIKQRQIDLTQYLIPGVQSVGESFNINNYQRESSVFIKTIEDREGTPVPPLLFPSDSPNMISGGTSIVTDISRRTISSSNSCATPSGDQNISSVCYYGSMKNDFVNQWGQIYSYETIDTGFQKDITPITGSSSATIFGGDTFISRFAFKTKIPFFFDNRVGAPDDSDIFYDEIGNVAYPKYWHSARSILSDYTLTTGTVMTNIISYKAHNFDCPNTPSNIPTGSESSYRTFYDGYFYLFAYGIPNFYCETSYNLDLRQAFNNKEGDFWPHVSTGIPDDWVQESYVSIANDNTYTYNVTFSKQNKENTFTHIPNDWDKVCYTNYPFRAIYSDPQQTDADNRVNNWLVYRALSYFDFPQNYGKLTSLDGIQNRAILARFENKSLMYNNLLTIDTSNPQAAYVGNPGLFKGAPPIDFAETDLGYVGSQNKFLLKIPQGQISIDAKRGQVFLISGTEAVDLSGFGSGMNRFFTDHLAFEILRYYPTADVDNHFNGLGLHGVYDSKFDRIILTKLDYIPIDKDVKYDSTLNEFYIETITNGSVFKTQVYLTDLEYFCNKSWTISFNFNTKTWVSFHSYLPNFYVGENNFFYSGINGCCSDIDGDFTALVGDMNRIIPTTTSTTTEPKLTTTTTTEKPKDCSLAGSVIATSCELEGTGIITVPPTTTTTICARPSNLFTFSLYSGYQYGSGIPIDSTTSLSDMCNSIGILRLGDLSISPVITYGYALTLTVGELIYDAAGYPGCTYIPDGYYYVSEGLEGGFGYYVLDGQIVEIVSCNCGTTTSTTTMAPTIEECCGILFSAADSVYFINNDSGSVITELTVPTYTSGYGIAMTANYLWSVTTEFLMWDITLSPFSATFNTAIPFPGAFTTSSGIVALNDTTLVAIDDSASPQDVVELVLDCNVNPPTFTSIVQFSLQADRIAIGNMLYTTGDKLIIINKDSVTLDYYITQYDYLTSTIEVDLNVGTSYDLVTLSECNCVIFAGDTSGNLYAVDDLLSGILLPIVGTGLVLESSTQVATCVPQSLNSNANITTTTTSTTTAFVPNPFCYEMSVYGDGTSTFTWVDYLGVSQSQTLANDTIYICAQLNTIDWEIFGGVIVNVTGGITSCASDGECVPTTTTTTTV